MKSLSITHRNMYVLFVLLFLSFVASLICGTVLFGPVDIISGLFVHDSSIEHAIIYQIRLPRALSAALVGASLGIAGCLLQVTTRNPLADPAILGVSALSGLALAVTTLIFQDAGPVLRAIACVVGGFIGAVALLLISRGVDSPLRITVVGVAIGAFASAGIVGAITGSRVVLELALGFLAGGLYGAGWFDASLWVVWIPAVCIFIIFFTRRLDNLALGDEVARNLGERPEMTRVCAILFSGLITGAAVSIGGLISIVGLASPHIASGLIRRAGPSFYIGSMIIGMFIVLCADTLARVVISPSELPAGILTAAIGAPILIYLVRREL